MNRRRITLNENQQALVLEGLRMIYQERVERAKERSYLPSDLKEALDELIEIADKMGGFE